jgi:hypothetical protein
MAVRAMTAVVSTAAWIRVSGEALHVEGKDAEVGSLLSQLGKDVPASSDSDESEGFFLWRTRRAEGVPLKTFVEKVVTASASDNAPTTLGARRRHTARYEPAQLHSVGAQG